MKKIYLMILLWLIGSAISVCISGGVFYAISPFLGEKISNLIGAVILALLLWYVIIMLPPKFIKLTRKEIKEIKNSKSWVDEK